MVSDEAFHYLGAVELIAFRMAPVESKLDYTKARDTPSVAIIWVD